MNLENIMLCKKSRAQRSHLYKTSRIGKSIETESKLVFAGGWGKEGEKRVADRSVVSSWGDEHVIK